ncbi:MAG: ACT domain-containing protein [Ruminococcaceae bacterium]|nr:ACT domain-containing protein [Oscillospiraceae bacterium]
MKAVITVVGKDAVGILAKVSVLCAENGGNIIDVTQTVMQDMFCMIMLCDTKELSVPFSDFVDLAEKLGEENNLKIHVMHEDLFNSMHRI